MLKVSKVKFSKIRVSKMTASAYGLMAAGLAASGAAGAVVTIEAGETVELGGITLAEDPTLSGVVLEDWTQGFSIESDIGEVLSGTIQSRASRRDDTGQIDLYWRVRGLSGIGEISSVVVTGFDGWSVGVEWRIDGLGDINPSHAIRTDDADSIGYMFADTLLSAPEESRFMLGRTDAVEYHDGGTVRINLLSGEHIELHTFAPGVPSPGGLGLLGLGGLMAARRRR